MPLGPQQQAWPCLFPASPSYLLTLEIQDCSASVTASPRRWADLGLSLPPCHSPVNTSWPSGLGCNFVFLRLQTWPHFSSVQWHL